MIHALMDLPLFGQHTPLNVNAHVPVMGEVLFNKDFLPGAVVCPSAASLVNTNSDFTSTPWLKMYPREVTLFVTLTENIEGEMETGGTQFLRPVMQHRLEEQRRRIKVSQLLCQCGYRVKHIDDTGSVMDIAHRIIDEIRLTQRNILEIQQAMNAAE